MAAIVAINMIIVLAMVVSNIMTVLPTGAGAEVGIITAIN